MMSVIRAKYKKLYLSAIGLLLPVVFQLSFIVLSLYLFYTGWGKLPVEDSIAWVLLCLLAFSQDIIMYCMRRIEAEGYSSYTFSSNLKISWFYKVLFILIVYLLPLSYILNVSSAGFIFWLVLLWGSARLAVYYVVRESEKYKIESFVWGLGSRGKRNEK